MAIIREIAEKTKQNISELEREEVFHDGNEEISDFFLPNRISTTHPMARVGSSSIPAIALLMKNAFLKTDLKWTKIILASLPSSFHLSGAD